MHCTGSLSVQDTICLRMTSFDYAVDAVVVAYGRAFFDERSSCSFSPGLLSKSMMLSM